MRVYGAITDYERSQFKTKFAAYYTLDPEGQTWHGLADILDTVKNRIEFRHSFGWSDMVLMLREWAVEAGLTREDRGAAPHVLEGYCGFVRK